VRRGRGELDGGRGKGSKGGRTSEPRMDAGYSDVLEFEGGEEGTHEAEDCVFGCGVERGFWDSGP